MLQSDKNKIVITAQCVKCRRSTAFISTRTVFMSVCDRCRFPIVYKPGSSKSRCDATAEGMVMELLVFGGWWGMVSRELVCCAAHMLLRMPHIYGILVNAYCFEFDVPSLPLDW
jgi:LSD1 subclass zinc finger protein